MIRLLGLWAGIVKGIQNNKPHTEMATDWINIKDEAGYWTRKVIQRRAGAIIDDDLFMDRGAGIVKVLW